MKKYIFGSLLFLIILTGCATTTKRNDSGYKIQTKRLDYNTNESGGKSNVNIGGWVAHEILCNDEKAFSIFELNGQSYLCNVNYDGKKFFVIIDRKRHSININDIIPESIARNKFDVIVKEKTGFNSLAELNQHRENQNRLAQEERRRQEEEKRQELIRLRNEVDNNFNVVAVGSLLHVKNGEVKIGEIIRLGDTFSHNMNWQRTSRGSYIFGDFQEFEIRGLDMRQVKVKEIKPDRSGYFMQGGGISAGGWRGYIVKYIGTEDVITQAGLRKVIWVLECIGGNIHAE